jgi:ElaB/YqjD/DUF883 family membrane-anchored ribosome-binding protein
MTPASTPEGSSGKRKKKKKQTFESSGMALAEPGETGDKVAARDKNHISEVDSVRAYVSRTPVRALLLTFGIGVIAGLLCHK